VVSTIVSLGRSAPSGSSSVTDVPGSYSPAARLPLRLRRWLALGSTVGMLGFVGGMFWYQDWRYDLPTPRPANLMQPPIGSRIPSPPAVMAALGEGATRPVFLHFMNPACPCTKFNREHVTALARRFGTDVTFLAVLEAAPDTDPAAAFASFGLPMRAVEDADGAIARAYGVYSTPQAVLVDARGRLRFRGNYNASRYCTDERTEFARIALERLLAGRPLGSIPAAATRAYGCALPANGA